MQRLPGNSLSVLLLLPDSRASSGKFIGQKVRVARGQVPRAESSDRNTGNHMLCVGGTAVAIPI